MSSSAIDFAALLAQARQEARARREKLQQEQEQQQQQQLRQQQHCQQQQQLGEQQQQQQQREHEEEELQAGWKARQEQEAESLRGRSDVAVSPSAMQHTSHHTEEERSETDAQPNLEQQRIHTRSSQEELIVNAGEDCPNNALSGVRLRAVDVQHVYNEIQQHTVGVGKRVLLIDLQQPAAFASKHVCQAVSGQQLLQDGQLLQRFQQQPAQTLLIYGASHEEDEIFQYLTRASRVAAVTAEQTQPSSDAAAASAAVSSSTPKETAATLLLQQLLQKLVDTGACQQQHTLQQLRLRQGEEEGQRPHCLPGGRCLFDRRRVSETTDAAHRKEKRVDMMWMRGGLEAFAVAFPFLCISSNTEEEVTAALTSTNSMAYLSYPTLVYSYSRYANAATDGTTPHASLSAAAAVETKAVENSAPDSAPSCLSASPEKQATCGGSPGSFISPAVASSLGKSVTAAPKVAEAVSAVDGLYVGTRLHAMSRAVHRRLRIGLIIDLTSEGIPAQLENRSSSSSRRERAPSNTCLSSSSSSSSSITRETAGHHRGASPNRCGTGKEEGEQQEGEELEPLVVRPLLLPGTRAAARAFLGYGSSNDNNNKGSCAATGYPWLLEGMPQRQREITSTTGRYLLPLDSCVELLKHNFFPTGRRDDVCEAFTGAAAVSACSSSSSNSGVNEVNDNSRNQDIPSNSDMACDRRGSRRNIHTQSNEAKRDIAKTSVVDTSAWVSGSKSRNTGQKKSVLIVHSGDSERWSGSAAATVVAGFLFVQQKQRLQLLLPRQEARMAVALLTAAWRSAPALEVSHRQQLQHFCEEEKRRRTDRHQCVASASRVADHEGRAYEGSLLTSSLDPTKSRLSPYHPLSANISSPGAATAAGSSAFAAAASASRQHAQSQASSISTAAGLEKKNEEERLDSTRVKRRDADDAHLTAATALHTITLCGLAAAPVFIVAEEVGDSCASLLRCDAAVKEGKEGRQGAESEGGLDETTRDAVEWPRHVLLDLDRITQEVKLLVAASAADGQGGCGSSCALERTSVTRADSINGDYVPVDQDNANNNRRGVAVGSSSRSNTGRHHDTVRVSASGGGSGEKALGSRGGDRSELLGHRESVAAFVLLASSADGDGERRNVDSPLVKKEVYEVGAVHLFASLCREEEDVEIRDMEAPASQVAAAVLSERSHIVKVDAAAALKAKRIAGSRLYQVAIEAKRVCAGSTVMVTRALPACIDDVCEAWELAANTVGCIVGAWSSVLTERDVSRVCEALSTLLEMLASACSVTLWKASLSTVQTTRMNVFARVTAAWGALLMNVSFLWIHHMAPVLYRSGARRSQREQIGRSHREEESESSRYKVSHAVLGETLLSILLQSILQLAKRLLLRQFTSDDGEVVSAPQERRLLTNSASRVGRDHASQLAGNMSVSTGEFVGSYNTDQMHMAAGRLPPQSAEKMQEEWFFGCPTVGLRLLLCALHGTFLRPQIVPKLQKKLLRNSAIQAHFEPQTSSVSGPEASTTASALAPLLDSPTSSSYSAAATVAVAEVAQAAAAAAVSSVRRIVKSDAVQTTLQLAQVWAAVHPESLEKLLCEALRGQEGATQRATTDKTKGTPFPASLGVVLRPLVFASEEYGEHKR